MWINKRSPRTDFVRFSPKESRPIQKQFQWKYTVTIAAFVFTGIAASVAPLVYFFNENYDIFVKLAYDHTPDLVAHLEQERQWLNSYILTAAITSIAFCAVFSMHVTGRIIGPLLVLQAHIKALIRGNWSIREVNIREKDEFRDLIASYNYLYYCLRQLTREDIEKLQSLSVDAQNRGAHNTWKKMIADKAEQIGYEAAPTDPFSKPSPSRDSRHAS